MANESGIQRRSVSIQWVCKADGSYQASLVNDLTNKVLGEYGSITKEEFFIRSLDGSLDDELTNRYHRYKTRLRNVVTGKFPWTS